MLSNLVVELPANRFLLSARRTLFGSDEPTIVPPRAWLRPIWRPFPLLIRESVPGR